MIKRYQMPSLLVGLCVFVGIVLYIDYYFEEKADRERELRGTIFDFPTDEVVSLRFFDRETDLEVSLERLDQGWVIEEPLQAKADRNTVESMLNAVAEYRHQHLISESRDDWQEFGVTSEDLSRSISWRLQDGRSYEFVIGHDTPVGFGVYFRTGSSEVVYSGSQYIVTATAKSLGDFREKSIVFLQPELVRRLAYLVNEELLAEFAFADGRYHFTYPVGITADHAAVARLLTDTLNALAAEFVDDPIELFKEQFRMASHKISVAWYGDPAHKDANGSLVLATMDNLFWARNHLGQYFRISAETMRSLTKHLKDFRHRAIVDFQANDVAAVDINGVNFVRGEDEEFYRVDDAVIGAHRYTHISNLIMDLIFARTQDFLDRADFELDNVLSGPPDVIIRVQFSPDLLKEDLHLRVWPHPNEGDSRLVAVTGQPNLFQVRASDLTNAHIGMVGSNRN